MILGEFPTRILRGLWRHVVPLVALGLGLGLLLLPTEWTAAIRQRLRVPIPWLAEPRPPALTDAERREMEEMRIVYQDYIRRLQDDLAGVSAFRGALGEIHPADRVLPVRVVLHGDADELRESITISAGTEAGVAMGDPVIHGSSLLGTVWEAGARRSVIRLVTDPGSRTRAFGQHFGSAVSVEGRGEGHMAISLKESLFEALAGEALLTLRNGKVPRGLILGRMLEPDEPDVLPLWDAATLDSAFVLLGPPPVPPDGPDGPDGPGDGEGGR